MSSYVGAIDQGTTSTRFIVFDRSARVVAVAQREHEQIYPQAGWVEHDAEEIWRRTLQVIDEAVSERALRPKDFAAIGITNQRETTVLWDRKTGAPVANAIVWQDTRTERYLKQFATREDAVRRKTGLPLSTYFSSLKLVWLLDNVPGLRQRAEAGEILFGTIDSLLAWRLTGGAKGGQHITDVTNASRTQLFDLDRCSWDEELLSIFGIPKQVLPTIRSSSEIYGTVCHKTLEGVPLAAILGDQQAALVGQTCFTPGEAKNTYGTGCFLLLNTGKERVISKHGLLTTAAYQFGKEQPHYALEGSVAITGALVQWLRDNLGIIQSSGEVETLARSVNDNGGVYFVPAFSGLYAPYWQANARGVIAGLTRYANKGHIARASLEATAYQTREVLEAMEQDSGKPVGIVRVDGGMVANELLMQFQSDILNREVVSPQVKETTALGAAFAAGLATDFFKSLNELSATWKVDRRWAPNMQSEQRDGLYRTWKKAVTRSMDWA
ncbi:MAG TPA: glycerol kinase GlpK [Terriglobales bacterium]|nr:glycerol kinase GlpK [Terriglobales bacterium]